MRVELRADGSAVISGYVNVTGKWSRVICERGRRFVETIAEGAFKRAIDEAEDEHRSIYCLIDHEERAIGQTADGSLRLKEDGIGLHAEVKVTDGEVVKRAASPGAVKGWSFGFQAEKEKRSARAEGEPEERTVEGLRLLEVSLIFDKMPCYKATSFEMRADGKEEISERSFGEEETAEICGEIKEQKPAADLDTELRTMKTRIAKLQGVETK